MASPEIFKHWTIKELQDYVRENGGNPDNFGEKKELMDEAARMCIAIERQFLADRAGTATTASATGAPASAKVGSHAGAGIAYGQPVGAAPAAFPTGAPPPYGGPPYVAPPPMGWWPGAAVMTGPPYGGPPPFGGPGGPPLMPTPALAAPAGPGAQGRGRKRALLCGCNYAGAPHALKGCINDVHCMAFLLKSKFGFTDADIVMLTDDQPLPQLWPTRANIISQMQILVWNVQPGDSLVFQFSGHGSQVTDYLGEESDGKNETLCPCDFKQAGMLVDDDINRLLVNPLPPGVRLHAIIDACHSGSALDLEHRCKAREGPMYWKQEYTYRPRSHKGTAGGEAIQIGASRDKQKAADTSTLSGYASTGAATFSFIQAIERFGPFLTYEQLLRDMFHTLRSVNGAAMPKPGSGMVGKFLNSAMDFLGMSGQTPVMCSNQPFDFATRPLSIM